MKNYISILRGINVSGQKKIKMADLKKHIENLGYEQVSTYIQSGNILFESEVTDISLLETSIADMIKKEYEFEVPVLVLEKETLQNVVADNPFLSDPNIDIDKLHVTFLAKKPVPEKVAALKELDFGDDQFQVVGKCVYLYCPNGYGRTKLTNNFFENKLKVIATTRNWKTVNNLLEMVE
ncbi:DUF1697 domain-containing protein [Limibacter armeniacum]|uniref:DUF1697 domain-containing protein n=1 Tax=Limibacter armeniacum TaxID=466084 RepID=UPI002FE505A3